MIEIDRVESKIHLSSPYDPRTVASCKRVPGAYWSKRARVWTFPLTIESCLVLRMEFGAQLKIRKALSDWYRIEAARRAELAALGAGHGQSAVAELPRLKIQAPNLWEAVTIARPYQSLGARFAVDGRSVLIADDPGLGKTLEALAAVEEACLPGPYLVVSPKTAATTVWPREIPRWLPGHSVIELPEGRGKREDVLNRLCADVQADLDSRDVEGFLTDSTWVSVHPEVLLTKRFWICKECGEETPWTTKPTSVLGCGHPKTKYTKIRNDHTFPQFFGIEWGAIIVDECHESLVRKSGTPTQRRMGLEMLQVRKDGLKIAMSGTPFRNKPWQLWGVLNWLRPKVYTGFWRWVKQYWETGGYSGWEIGKIIEERESMLWDEVSSVMLRRTKAEVARDLPPKAYVGSPLDPSDEDSPVGIWLPMAGKQLKAYRAMLQDSSAQLERGRVDAVGTLAELIRLRQFAGAYGTIDEKGDFMPTLPSNKFDWLEDFLGEMGIPGEPTGKVVVVSQFTRMLRMCSFGLSASQNGSSCMLTGDITGAKRKQIIDAFNQPLGTDSPHIMFLQVKAGGVAITIDSADDMVMLDESDPDTMIQVEDRIHRVSNPRPVRYHYLRSLESVDVGTARVNAVVAARGRRLLDERRGVEFFRKVLELSNG